MRKKIFDRLTEKAEVSEEAKEYIRSKASMETQAYHAGGEEGYKRGEVAGFAKGVAATVLTAGVAVAGYFIKKNKNSK